MNANCLLLKILRLTVMFVMAIWGFGALYFDLPLEPRKYIAFGYLVIAVMLVALSWSRIRALILFLMVFVMVLGWWLSIKPSSEKEWQSDVAVLPFAEIKGEQVTVHNIRNADYRSEFDYTVGYYDRTFSLEKLQSIDLIVTYWDYDEIAHLMFSFGFAGDQYLAVSIETRKAVNQQYSTLGGFFKQFQKIYVVADERDVVRLRTNFRHEKVYLYRLKVSPEKARGIFLEYVNAINKLHDSPAFYNSFTDNCTTNIFYHVKSVLPQARPSLGLFLTGYIDQVLFERNSILKGGIENFSEFKNRSFINTIAERADTSPIFSNQIRSELPWAGMKSRNRK